MRKLRVAGVLAVLLSLTTVSLSLAAAFVGPIYDGTNLDYQPSIIRVQPSGQLMIVYERLAPVTNSGDLYVSVSNNGGQTWTTPQVIINTAGNERHPALLQLGTSSFVLFYLSNETGSFRIHRATSADGLSWSGQGAIDLGWATGGELNPAVIREANNTLTMTYQRSGGASYLARSSDNGVTWDKLKTQVSPGTSALPRIAKRESDGKYLVTYQTGGSVVSLFSKVTSDPYNWNVTQTPFSIDANSHDSQPIVLEDGKFVTFYTQQTGSAPFNIHYRVSNDGISWGPKVAVTKDRKYYNLQPHPLLHGTPGHVILTWSHQESAQPYQDHDVWINTDLTLSLNVSLLPLISTEQQ
jgi:hypothetical protein